MGIVDKYSLTLFPNNIFFTKMNHFSITVYFSATGIGMNFHCTFILFYTKKRIQSWENFLPNHYITSQFSFFQYYSLKISREHFKIFQYSKYFLKMFCQFRKFTRYARYYPAVCTYIPCVRDVHFVRRFQLPVASICMVHSHILRRSFFLNGHFCTTKLF